MCFLIMMHCADIILYVFHLSQAYRLMSVQTSGHKRHELLAQVSTQQILSRSVPQIPTDV
jgi:hypothetical protein